MNLFQLSFKTVSWESRTIFNKSYWGIHYILSYTFKELRYNLKYNVFPGMMVKTSSRIVPPSEETVLKDLKQILNGGVLMV